MNSILARGLRWAAIILLALTATFNILGGIGTTCAAFLTEQFDSMAAILDYRWLYQVFVVSSITIGLAGTWATINLGKGRKESYRQAFIVLFLGTIVAASHYFASLSIRGKAAPANVKFYINLLSLLVFALLLIPGLREKAGFDDQVAGPPGTGAPAVAAIVVGILVLTTNLWAGGSHTIEGVNWVERISTPLQLSGAVLLLAGLLTWIRNLVERACFTLEAGLGSQLTRIRWRKPS